MRMGWFSFSRKDKQTSGEAEGAYVARSEEAAARNRNKRASAKVSNEPVDPVLPEKKRARRRLVGAIALALAVIIGLPMVLDSEPKPLAGDIAIQIPSKDKPYSAGDAASRPRSGVPAEQALDQGEELVDMGKPSANASVNGSASASANGSANASASALAIAAKPAANAASQASTKPSATAQGTSHLAAETKPRAPEAKPGDGKTGEIKPAEQAKPAETRTAEVKTAEAKNTETKSAETKAAEAKIAEAKAKAAELKEAEHKAALAKAAETRAAETRAAEAKARAAEHKAAETRAAEHKHTETKVAKPAERKPVDPADSKPVARAEQDAERAKALLEGNAEAAKSEAKPAKYVVQVAALATQEKIDELQGKLRAAGISSHTQKVATETGTRTRIRVGPFSDKEEASKMREKLIKLGLSGTLIPQ